MRKSVFVGVLMAGLAAFAGSAEPDGTDFVVTAGAGESFTITDAENLETYAKHASVVAFKAQAVNGTPALAFEGEHGPTKWALINKGNGTYNFGALVGTMLLLK